MRPLSEQGEKESHRVWQSVTNALLERDFSGANHAKHAVEQEQRNLAKRRTEKGERYVALLATALTAASRHSTSKRTSQTGGRGSRRAGAKCSPPSLDASSSLRTH